MGDVDIMAELRRMHEMATEGRPPVVPRCIRTSVHIRIDKVYRQWMTNGDLHVWVSRALIDSIPAEKRGFRTPWSIDLPLGIPVIHDDD